MQWLFREKRVWKTLLGIWNTLHRSSCIVETQMEHEPIFGFSFAGDFKDTCKYSQGWFWGFLLLLSEGSCA